VARLCSYELDLAAVTPPHRWHLCGTGQLRNGNRSGDPSTAPRCGAKTKAADAKPCLYEINERVVVKGVARVNVVKPMWRDIPFYPCPSRGCLNDPDNNLRAPYGGRNAAHADFGYACKMDEPSLLREIAKVAWLMTKIGLSLVSAMGLMFLLFRRHPLLGIYAFWGLFLAGFAAFGGWTVYKDKKRDFEWRKRDEERHLEWNEARARRDKSA
jgi:hypothetical protein